NPVLQIARRKQRPRAAVKPPHRSPHRDTPDQGITARRETLRLFQQPASVSLGCFFFIASLQKKRMVISLHPIRTTLAAGQLDLTLQVKIPRTLKLVNISYSYFSILKVNFMCMAIRRPSQAS